MAAHCAIGDTKLPANVGRMEVLPIAENHHSTLPHAEPSDCGQDLGPVLG